MKKILISLLLLIVSGLLFGCAGWRPAHEAPEIQIPDSYLESNIQDFTLNSSWWEDFGDTTLNRLMDELFAENLNLEIQAERLNQSRAALKAARGSWFPAITASGSVTHADVMEESASSSPMTPDYPVTTYSAGVNVAYEVDLWGKLSSNRQAAYSELLASENDMRSLLMTMSAQMARSYYAIIELRHQLKLSQSTVKSFEAYKELVNARYKRGVSASVDVYQAEESLKGAQAGLEKMKAQLKSAENSFSVLLARYPDSSIIPESMIIPENIEEIQPGIPGDLLKRRPDIQAAYFRMIAADKKSAEAVASRFPSINLTGNINGSSDELAKVLDPENILWNAIGSVAMPIFQGGRLEASAQSYEAAWKASVASYKQSALEAFAEVENVLTSSRHEKLRVAQLTAQEEASSARLRLATDQYLQGVTSYLPVVLAQTSYYNVQSNLISARRNLVDLRIQLAIALGGSWTDEIIEEYLSEKSLKSEI